MFTLLFICSFTLRVLCMTGIGSTVTPVVKKWILDSRIRNSITNTDLIAQYDNVSKRECAVRCTNTKHCMSFFYTNLNKWCRIHSNRFVSGTSMDHVEFTSGTDFYTDPCNTGQFMYDSTIDKYLIVRNVIETDKANAQQACEAKGATLARLKSLGYIEAVRDAFQNNVLSANVSQPVHGLWLGAEFGPNTGKIFWSDGEEVDVNIPSMWKGGQLSFEGRSFCMALLLPPETYYKLAMIPCTTGHITVPLCECIP